MTAARLFFRKWVNCGKCISVKHWFSGRSSIHCERVFHSSISTCHNSTGNIRNSLLGTVEDHGQTEDSHSIIHPEQVTADLLSELEKYRDDSNGQILDDTTDDRDIQTRASKHPNTSKTLRSSKLKKNKMFFEEHFQNSVQVLGNYIQACLFSGHLTQALNTLKIRIKSVEESTSTVSPSKIALDPLIYDLVLSRLAAISPSTTISSNFMGSSAYPLDIICKIFGEMKRLNLKPQLSAYASALEAMDKCPNQNVRIALCLQQIQDDGYTLDEVAGTCCHGSKSAKHVRHAIMRVAEYNQYHPLLRTPDTYKDEVNELPSLVRDLYISKKTKPGALNLSAFSKQEHYYVAQLLLEKNRVLKVSNILKSQLSEKDKELQNAQLLKLLDEWRAYLLKALQDLKKSMKTSYITTRPDWKGHYVAGAGGKVYPFLCLLPEQEYVEIIINHLCSMMNGGDFTSLVCYKLGEEVYARFAMRRMKDASIMQRLKEVYKEYIRLYVDKELQSTFSPRQLWLKLEEKHGLTYLEEKVLPWNSYWTFTVGMKLVELMHTLSYLPQFHSDHRSKEFSTAIVPAVYNSYAFHGRKQYGMTIPHPQFRMLLQQALDKLTFELEDAPMVVPPRPWCGATRGGLLASQVTFMRTNTIDENLDPESTLKEESLGPIFDSLNILGSVAWIINKPILDLQLKYFRNMGSRELNIPQPASMSEPMPALSLIRKDDITAYEQARKMAVAIRKERKEMHSLFMEALYKLSIANEYRDNTVWFAHNIDFRGRFYPVPRHFNYMGSDVYRSLFLFAEGHPLGENGLSWLKLHCINLTEFKKHSSVGDRLKYADEVLDRILASADEPDADDAWWKASDKPWQTLAACLEIAAAVRSPDPTKYISRLPVHQDGSCNGLQHYAALGRDVLGAQQVNLSPSIIPQDVYTGVAEQAEALRKKDAENGVKIAQTLEGFVRRKVVKQTVMTTVYGVTRYGGMQQISRQLKYLEDEFPRTECGRGANYLVDKVFESITEMFTGAKNIQAWFTQLADVISKMGYPIGWTTPLNLIVTQPYFKQVSRYIASPVQRLGVAESITTTPNRTKQVNGFPPNFVHSLDSTHMMLTALHCYKRDLRFCP